MAQLAENSPLQGMRGMLGGVVFRSFNGKTVISTPPSISRRRRKNQSDPQRLTRTKFRDAAMHAKMMMQDPAIKEVYRKKAQELKLPNAYTAALKEYMLTDIQEP